MEKINPYKNFISLPVTDIIAFFKCTGYLSKKLRGKYQLTFTRETFKKVVDKYNYYKSC